MSRCTNTLRQWLDDIVVDPGKKTLGRGFIPSPRERKLIEVLAYISDYRSRLPKYIKNQWREIMMVREEFKRLGYYLAYSGWESDNRITIRDFKSFKGIHYQNRTPLRNEAELYLLLLGPLSAIVEGLNS